MIEWLITDNNFYLASIVLSFIIVTVVISLVLSNNQSFSSKILTFSDWLLVALIDVVLSLVLTFLLASFFVATISSKPAESSEWKTIYDLTGSSSFNPEISKSLSEDLKISESAAESITSNLSNSESNGVKIKISYGMSSVEAGNEIGKRFADIFSNLKDRETKKISINASKSRYEKSKDFKLTKDNLMSDGDIDETSKLVKIETKIADYTETEFFGFKGTNRFDQTREVRITLENDTKVQKEVNEILE